MSFLGSRRDGACRRGEEIDNHLRQARTDATQYEATTNILLARPPEPIQDRGHFLLGSAHISDMENLRFTLFLLFLKLQRRRESSQDLLGRARALGGATAGKLVRPAKGLFKDARDPALDGAVNKRLLSTGETREFVTKNVGFDLNPGG